MYVRIEVMEGFIVKGFKEVSESFTKIKNARQRLMLALESFQQHPRVTYGIITSPIRNGEKIHYVAGVIADALNGFPFEEQVLVSSGKYVVATLNSQEEHIENTIRTIYESDYFSFRQSTIIEKYIRNFETGEYDIEVWIPIQA